MAEYLRQRGWVILASNVRVGRDEIDLVAVDGDTHVVIEVRARASGALADALHTITPAKAKRLRRAARAYQALHGVPELRIDVAAVRGDEIELVANAIDFTST